MVDEKIDFVVPEKSTDTSNIQAVGHANSIRYRVCNECGVASQFEHH
jgi:hypothetical protein